MEYVTLGRTSLLVSRTAFGAMSLDSPEINSSEDPDETACAIVHEAYSYGINFFDASHSKPHCEKRVGFSLHGIRQNVLLATKTRASSVQELRLEFSESLSNLDTDSVDLYQIENPLVLPVKDGADGIYKELCALKEKGKIKHFGIATEDFSLAKEAVLSGLYETVQFPYSIISSEEVSDFADLCAEKDVGFIAMQPLNGGIITNIPLAFGFLSQKENVVPVWGCRTQTELEQIVYFNNHPPVIDEKFKEEVNRMREFFN